MIKHKNACGEQHVFAFRESLLMSRENEEDITGLRAAVQQVNAGC